VNSYRVQDLVRNYEIGAPGTITGVAYQAENDAVNAQFNAFQMKLCHTSLEELTSSFSGNYDGNEPELVAAADPVVLNAAADDWFDIPGFQPFHYDGVDSLIIEVQWMNDNGTDLYTWITNTDTNRLLYHKYLDEDEGFLEPIYHRFRITIEFDENVEVVSWGVIKAGF
jgi:hypothetical protein